MHFFVDENNNKELANNSVEDSIRQNKENIATHTTKPSMLLVTPKWPADLANISQIHITHDYSKNKKFYWLK